MRTPSRPRDAGTHSVSGHPETKTLVKFVVGSFRLDSVLLHAEGSILDPCCDTLEGISIIFVGRGRGVGAIEWWVCPLTGYLGYWLFHFTGGECFILFSIPKLFRENVILYWKSLECMYSYILILIVGASVSCTALLFLFCVLYRSCLLFLLSFILEWKRAGLWPR